VEIRCREFWCVGIESAHVRSARCPWAAWTLEVTI